MPVIIEQQVSSSPAPACMVQMPLSATAPSEGAAQGEGEWVDGAEAAVEAAVEAKLPVLEGTKMLTWHMQDTHWKVGI